MKRKYSTIYAATFTRCDNNNLINKIPNQIWEKIFQNMDETSLVNLEQVCKRWNGIITDENRKTNWIWKSLIEKKVKNDSNWKSLAGRRGWIKDLFDKKNTKPDSYYRSLFPQTTRDIRRIKSNFFSGSGSTEQLLQVPIDDLEVVSVIEVNDKNIFIGTYSANINGNGNIKMMNRKGPIQWKTVGSTTNQINDLQGRFL